MPRKSSLLHERVRKLVPAEWTDAEDIMDQAIPLVPPGRALRRYADLAKRFDIEREERRKAGGKQLPRKPIPSQADQIRMGARSIVNDTLASMRDSEAVEMRFTDGRKGRQFRLSQTRPFAHHCCLHGGSCRPAEEVEAEHVAAEAAEEDPLGVLIERVLESRAQRLGPPPAPQSTLDGPTYVEVGRLLQEVR